MSSGLELSKITPAEGLVIFDQLTAQVLPIYPFMKIDEEVARMLLSPDELLPFLILQVDSAYVSKGYIPV